MKNKYDIISIGGLTKDFFILTPEGKIIKENSRCFLSFLYGEKIYVDKIEFSLGGGACNTAVGFSRLGLKSALYAALNKSEDKDVLDHLKREKVGINYIQNCKKESIGTSFIVINSDTKGKEHIIFSYRGANKFLTIKNITKTSAQWIYLASLSGKKWKKEFNKITKIVSSGKINLAFNPGRSQISSGVKNLSNILRRSKILILNREEGIELAFSRYHYNEAPHIYSVLKKLHGYTKNLVVVTDGAHGAYAYQGEKFYFQKALSAKTIDTTGAGDAFSSGFVACFIKTGNIKKSLLLGAQNAASVVKYIGAQKGLLRRKI